MTSARGFTLIELLVALAIFALMAAMAYGGLASVLDTREDVNAAIDRTHALQGAVFRIKSDLEQTAPRSIRDQFGDPQPALAGSADTGLALTRNGWRNPLRERRSHLQRVAYHTDGEDRLIRLHWRVLDRAEDSAPVETVLLEDVRHLEWRYLDAEGKWQDRWPPIEVANRLGPSAANATTRLPRVVELRLETKHSGRIRYLFRIPRGVGR